MGSWGNCVTSDGVFTLNCIPGLVGNLVYWALVFAGVVALIFIIYSGIKFLTSQGDPKQVEGARKTLTYAILGLILILSSFAIVSFIAQTTGVGCITRFGFTNCGSSRTNTCTVSSSNYCSRANPGGCCDFSGQTCTRVSIERPPGYNYVCR